MPCVLGQLRWRRILMLVRSEMLDACQTDTTIPVAIIRTSGGDGGRWCEQPFTHIPLPPLRCFVQTALSVGVYAGEVDAELTMHVAAELERGPSLCGPHRSVAAVRVTCVRVHWWMDGWVVGGS